MKAQTQYWRDDVELMPTRREWIELLIPLDTDGFIVKFSAERVEEWTQQVSRTVQLNDGIYEVTLESPYV